MNEGARLWWIRLLALAIAVGLWWNDSYREREAIGERTVTASISYNQPRNYVILNPSQTVTVRLRGRSKSIRRLDPATVSVQVDVTETEPGNVVVDLKPENVLMPEDLQVVSIRPNFIRMELDREVTRSFPVRVKLAGEPAPGARVDKPVPFPPRVEVTGPESMLDKLRILTTRPVDLDGRAAPFEEEVDVVLPDPLIVLVEPPKVAVRVPIAPPPPQAVPPAPSPTPEGRP